MNVTDTEAPTAAPTPPIFTSRQYDPTSISTLLRNLPRFASSPANPSSITHDTTNPRYNSRNVALLFSSVPSQRNRYILGASSLPLGLSILYGLWFLIALFLKAKGKAGFCSGKAIVYAWDSHEDDNHTAEETKSLTSGRSSFTKNKYSSSGSPDGEEQEALWRRILCCCCGASSSPGKWCYQKLLVDETIRSLFALSSVTVLIFGGTLLYKALPLLLQSTAHVHQCQSELHDLLEEAHNISGTVMELGYSTEELRRIYLEGDKLEEYCPGGNSLPQMLDIDSQAINEGLVGLYEMTIGSLADVHSKLTASLIASQSIDEFLEMLRESAWMYQLYLYPLLLSTLYMMLCSVLSHLGDDVLPVFMERLFGYFVLPLFSALSFLGCVLSCGLLLIAIINADVCLGGTEEPYSPDETVMNILREVVDIPPEQRKSDMVFKAAHYYIEGCTSNDELFFSIDPIQNQLQDAVKQIDAGVMYSKMFGMGLLSSLCNNDVSVLVSAMEELESIMIRLSHMIDSTMQLVGCKRIRTIYELTMHKTTCSSVVDGLGWTVLSLIVISLGSLSMISLRSSCRRNHTDQQGGGDDDEDETEEDMERTIEDDEYMFPEVREREHGSVAFQETDDIEYSKEFASLKDNYDRSSTAHQPTGQRTRGEYDTEDDQMTKITTGTQKTPRINNSAKMKAHYQEGGVLEEQAHKIPMNI